MSRARLCASGVVRLFGIVLGLMMLSQVAAAQSGPPFTCTGEIYQVQSGQLRIFDPISSSYQNVGSNQGSYNATGYNVLDNYAYGSQGSRVIRIAADGSTEVVFTGISGSFSGDVDRSGNFWLRTNNKTYRRINLATGEVTVFNFSGPNGGPADVTYIIIGGKEYLIGVANSTMFRYNITDGTKENISVSGGLPRGAWGAAWTDFNGRLFVFNNTTGEIWEIFDYTTGSPSAVFVAQADPSGNNDGFSCPQGPFPNLPPLAFDDDYTTPVNVAVTDNVITNNDNGIDNDPEGGPVTVNTTPITDPARGTVVLNTDGTFTYTPDTNFIGTDTFVYEITDITGLTAQATVTIVVEGTIDFTLDKSLAAGPDPVTEAGQVLTYRVEIENIGDIPLTDVVAVDTAPDGTEVTLSGQTESGGAPDVPGQLDVGETWTYSYDYTVTQADIDSGAALVNDVEATTEETGDTVKQDSVTVPITQTITLTLDKTVDTANLSAPGLLTYQIVVTNTGNVTLTNARLTDVARQGAETLTLSSGPDLTGGDTDADGDLDVGEVWTYAATFEAEQDQIDAAADIVNTATFTTTEGGALSDDAVTTVTAAPAMTVTKTADTASLSAPGLITYQIVITNDGNVTLTGVDVTDDLVQGAEARSLSSGPDLSGDLDADGEIDVGETWTLAATFEVTQAEIDNGAPITNTVTVATNELPDASDTAQTLLTQSPAFTLAKAVDLTELSAPGPLRYTIEVVNTGNVTLTGIDFADTITQSGGALTPATGPTLAGDTDADGALDVGESWLYTLTLDVTQPMIDDGGDIVNAVSFDPAEAPAQTDDATTVITQEDALDLAKAVAAGDPTSFDAVGDEIDFTFVVTNTGNTTRPGPILIDDNQIGTGLVCQAGDLAPGAAATCSFTWTAEQADLNAGSVTNTATASDASGLKSPERMATVTAVQTPQITILKKLGQPLPNFQPGETLPYDLTVVNTGNVTLDAPITVTDNLLSNLVCDPVPAGGLVPSDQTRAAVLEGTAAPVAGSTFACTGSHVITLADVNVGSITNVAAAEAVHNGSAVTHQDDAIFPVDAEPKLVLDKSTDPDPAAFAMPGDTITYTYAITNQQPVGGIGVAITQPVTVDDDKLPAPFVCYDPAAPGNGPINVGDTVTCTADYPVTQEDLDAESITNNASASTTFTAGDGSVAVVNAPTDTVTVTADLIPGLTLSKTTDAGAPSPARAGDLIPYTIVATNSGAQTLSNVEITDPQLGTLTCAPATAPVILAPAEMLTCTGSYEVTQADIDSQTVGDTATATFENTATVTANDPFGTALTPVSDTALHPLDPAMPGLSLVKALDPDPAADPAYEAVGDVLRFRMTVTNTGNATITALEVTDSLVPGTCEIAALAPGGQDQSCFFDYVVTQEDIDTGRVENTGSVTGQPANPGAEPVGAQDEHESPGPEKRPLLEVVKAGSLDLGADGVASVGDQIAYQITVTNTGNVTITDTAVSDPTVAPLSYAAADDADGDADIDRLLPGDSAVVTAIYTLDQDDIDAGRVTNTAEATGTDPDGAPVTDVSDSSDPNDGAGGDDPTVTDIGRGPGLSLDKSVSADTDVTEGTVLTYTYVVVNTGNLTLTDVTVTDQHSSAGGTSALALSPDGGVIETLLPGGSATFTATYRVTQADIDAGADLTNTATARASSPPGTAPPTATDDEVVDLVDRVPGVRIDKSVSSDTDVTVGTVLTYSYEVENTGNVTLTNLTLDDQHSSASGTSALTIAPDGGVIAVLEPGQSATLTASYTVDQADIDAGADITNAVTVTTQSPPGTTPPTDSDTESVDLDDPAPALEVLKTVSGFEGLDAGDEVSFAITVRNTGNVTLSDVALTDTLRRADGTEVPDVPAPVWDGVDDGRAGLLDVGEDWVYRLSYELTQADVDAGGITNSVLAEAEAPNGDPVTDVSDTGTGDGDDPTPLLIPAAPGLETVKVITSDTVLLDGTVQFQITLRNTGNVTLRDVAVSSDTLTRNDPAGTPLGLSFGPGFTGADQGSGEGVLQVGETATYQATYVLTQADIDAGGITNTATGTGTPPIGDPVTDVSDDGGAGEDPTVLEIPAAPAILFDKRLAAGAPVAFDAEGQVLRFEFEITNDGNVTLEAPFAVSDPLIEGQGGRVTCGPGPIAPGASVICAGDYVTTQADVDAGGITNAATATVGDAPPVRDEVPVPATQTPGLALVKEAPSIAPEDFVSGLVVPYTFTATNTGNTTLTVPIVIEDALFDPADYTCDAWPDGGLAPGGVYVCRADYTVTPDDVALAVVVNNAVASSGETDSPVATKTIPNDGRPALTLEKSLIRANQPDGSDSGTLTFDEVGDQLVYRFEVTNAGDVAFARAITVTDTLLADPVTCFEPSGTDPELASGESATCEATYIVTQDDVDVGRVLNEAFARTEFGGIPTIVLSEPDDVEVVATLDPRLSIEKVVAEASYAAVGDTLNYTITVTNTGNQTLTNVAVTDPLVPALSCAAARFAVGEVLTCTATYEIQQRDIDAGEVLNRAEVNGVTPGGDPVEPQQDTATSTGPTTPPSLALEKIAVPGSFGAVGSDLTFVFRVTNTSIFTLRDVTVTDDLPDGSGTYTCEVGTLLPGAVSQACSVAVEVTQEDVDAGRIVNTAEARGTAPGDRPVLASDTATVPGPERVPAIELTKLASVPATTVGSTITYTLRAENTGNVSLSGIDIGDDLTRNDGTILEPDTPITLATSGGFATGDRDTDGLLDPGEVWTYGYTYVITQLDVNAGGLSNTATVFGTPPGGGSVFDASDDGNDGDGNTADDPTEVAITTDPVLNVEKVITQSAGAPGETLIFEIRAANRGNVDLFDVVPSDRLTRADGTDLSAAITGPSRTPNAADNGDAILAPGELWTYSVSYVLTQDDIDAGSVSNTASVTAQNDAGTPVTDVSDNGEDGDGNTTDDPTVVTFAPEPGLEVIKLADSVGAAEGETVVFVITGTNTGNVTLSNIALEDTMTNGDGAVLSPVDIQTAGLTDAGELPPGAAVTYTLTYTLTQADVNSGEIANTATISGLSPTGSPVQDISDDGDEGTGDTGRDPTIAPIEQNPAAVATKEADIPRRLFASVYEVTFTMTLANTGNVTLTDLVITDDLAPFLAPGARLVEVDRPVVSGFDIGVPNGGYDGLRDTQLVASGAELAPGSTGTIVLTLRYDTSAGSPRGSNTISAVSTELIVPATAETPVILSNDPDILASKTASPTTVQLGDTVTYTLRFENRLSTIETSVQIVDTLPAGMVYTPGSAVVTNGPADAPSVSGRRLTWQAFDMAPGQVTTITYRARLVDGDPGEYVNTAVALGPDGQVLSNTATATVTRRPEAVFDCTDIIGKVFDDKNMNGAQDGLVRDPGITDQSFARGKFGAPPKLKPGGEPGLPNVRLATPNGTLITTDAYGRFSVPCAAIPAGDIGSNFMLKLDTRTLPSGYFVTTENPRVIRVTRGTLSKMNFGATLGNLVEIDLMAPAFKRGGTQPSAALASYVDQLVGQIRRTPSVVRLTYYRAAESQRAATARLDALEKLIRKTWRGKGRYRLTIERIVRRTQ